MKNRIDALRGNKNGVTITLPTEYDDKDTLICRLPDETVSLPDNINERFNVLIEMIKKRGFVPEGCFNCRFFYQAGATEDIDVALGYCLEGKTGQHLNPSRDLTSQERICDGYSPDDGITRRQAIDTWTKSIGR